MTATQIRRQVRDILGALALEGTLPLPATTLTDDMTAGETSFDVDPLLDALGRPRILGGMRGFFYDGERDDGGNRERVFTVASVTFPDADDLSSDPWTVDIEPSPAIGWTGFSCRHEAGTPVIFNLQDSAPHSGAAGMVLGDPFVFVTAYEAEYPSDVMPDGGFPLYGGHIGTAYLLDRPDTTGVDDESWAAHIEESTSDLLEAIVPRLKANPDLATEFEDGIAVQLGAEGSRLVATATFGPAPFTRNGAVWVHAGIVQFHVLADGLTY